MANDKRQLPTSACVYKMPNTEYMYIFSFTPDPSWEQQRQNQESAIAKVDCIVHTSPYGWWRDVQRTRGVCLESTRLPASSRLSRRQNSNAFHIRRPKCKPSKNQTGALGMYSLTQWLKLLTGLRISNSWPTQCYGNRYWIGWCMPRKSYFLATRSSTCIQSSKNIVQTS